VPDRALPGQQINNTVGGAITIEDATGAIVANQVIAVIFAPGQALPGKDRSTIGKTTCGGNNNPVNYLDIAQGIDNSKGGGAGNNIFITSTPSATFNDKLVYITTQDLYQVVSKRMVRELLGNVMGNAGPVDYYPNNANTYPCPSATANGVQDCALPSGVVNNAATGMNLQYPALGAWLSNNNWFANETYAYFAPSHVKLTVIYAPGRSYSCDANASIYTCTSP
jgi:hypothetical protein